MKTFISKFKLSPLLVTWTILVNLFLLISIITAFVGSSPVMPLTFVLIFTGITNIKAYQLFK